MITFLFPILLGALIGFTLDDGKINKSDFTNINKELVDPISNGVTSAKNSIVKAYENANVNENSIPKP